MFSLAGKILTKARETSEDLFLWTKNQEVGPK